MKATYCFDTSSFLEGSSVRPYPLDLFPRLWEKLDGLVQKGRIISAEEVLEELGRKTDAIAQWATDRKMIFLSPDAKLQNAFKRVMAEYPGLVDTRRGRGGADPWVVALARITRDAVVVSQEARAARRMTIPSACDGYSLKCVTLTEVIRREGWEF